MLGAKHSGIEASVRKTEVQSTPEQQREAGLDTAVVTQHAQTTLDMGEAGQALRDASAPTPDANGEPIPVALEVAVHESCNVSPATPTLRNAMGNVVPSDDEAPKPSDRALPADHPLLAHPLPAGIPEQHPAHWGWMADPDGKVLKKVKDEAISPGNDQSKSAPMQQKS